MFVKKSETQHQKEGKEKPQGQWEKEFVWIKERVELHLYKVSPEEKTTRPINYETQIILF